MDFSNRMQQKELYDDSSFNLSIQLSTQETQGFDYAVLTPEVRILVENKTSELKSLMRRSAQDIIDIGKNLLEVKEQIGHGNFRTWLLAEFDWSVRTATRFMQVATQFKCANLAHLNIVASALYLLAEQSTPEKARIKALRLAKEGDILTYTKAQAIVSSCQEETQANAHGPATIDISAKATQGNSLTASEPYQSMQTYSQPEPKDEANSATIEILVETVPTIESDKRLEQETVEKIDSFPREDLEVAVELQPELSNHIRVLNIEHQNLELVNNTPQTFDLTFAGVRVDCEGYPEILINLFEQMQNNPAFTEEILRQSRLLAANGIVKL